MDDTMKGSCAPDGCGACYRPCFTLRSPSCPTHPEGCAPDDHAEPPTVANEVV
jgi:hypothetical protein